MKQEDPHLNPCTASTQPHRDVKASMLNHKFIISQQGSKVPRLKDMQQIVRVLKLLKENTHFILMMIIVQLENPV